jgi:purine nucleoside permease
MFFEPIGIAGVQPWAGVIGVTIFEKYVESGVSTSIYEVKTL